MMIQIGVRINHSALSQGEPTLHSYFSEPCLHLLGGGGGLGRGPGGPQYGPVAVSALGSGRACPATVIAFCPSCQLVARPLSVRRTGVHPSTLPPLATLAVRALLG